MVVDEPEHRDDASADRRARFEASYLANYDPIFVYALRRSHSLEDATDVVAETFLTLWRRLEEIPPDQPARLWLYATARRVLANHRRGQLRHERLITRLRWGLTGGKATTETAGPGPTAEIAAAFARLSAADRELLALVAWDGLTPAEAAQVLGRSAGAVRVSLHRARARFARQLAAEGIARVDVVEEQDLGTHSDQ